MRPLPTQEVSQKQTYSQPSAAMYTVQSSLPYFCQGTLRPSSSSPRICYPRLFFFLVVALLLLIFFSFRPLIIFSHHLFFSLFFLVFFLILLCLPISVYKRSSPLFPCPIMALGLLLLFQLVVDPSHQHDSLPTRLCRLLLLPGQPLPPPHRPLQGRLPVL